MAFELHPRLAADTIPVGALALCRVLLMNDANYPWCILVPEREGVREIHALAAEDQQHLMREIAAISIAMEDLFAADKMNVAALGNQVPQLHVHIIARFETDPAWPTPAWGRLPPRAYGNSELDQLLIRLHSAFNPIMGFRTSP